uniref:Uncharacterized protein n=1 Tax=Oryza sativa subsp. japonica TaxID=39947 RepID=Q6YSX6_ORYSJ|nr:hypothetical protein [Oryza sativa Japonica Group]BAD31999.1 hypothetical protein [Oryza sativa Japonica Group]
MVAHGEKAVVAVHGATASGCCWSEEFVVGTTSNRVCCIFFLSAVDMWATSHNKEIASFKVVKEVKIKVEYLIGDENG